MARIVRLDPVFVDLMPKELEPGKLYVSIEHVVTKHLCACGCGHVVVLPLHPQQWQLTYDGDTVWMAPSVGNVGLPCRSHYWIERGRIDWSHPLSDDDVRRGIVRDRRDLTREPSRHAESDAEGVPHLGFWDRLLRRLRLRV